MAQAKPTKRKVVARKKKTTKSTRPRARAPQTLKSLNPRTGETRGEVPATAPGEVSDFLAEYEGWDASWSERARWRPSGRPSPPRAGLA